MTRAASLLAAFLLALLPGHAAALTGIEIALGDIQGEGWHLHNPRMVWEEDTPPGVLALRIDRIQLPKPLPDLRAISLRCAELDLRAEAIACARGRLSLQAGELTQSNTAVSFKYAMSRNGNYLRVQGMHLAGGEGQLDLRQHGSDWTLKLEVANLDAGRAADLARSFGVSLEESLAGSVNLLLESRLNAQGLQRMSAKVQFTEFAFASPDGMREGAELNGMASARWESRAGKQRGVELEAELRAGVLYVDPWYMEFDSHPLQLGATLDYTIGGDELRFASVRLHQRDLLQATGSARLRMQPQWELLDARAEIAEAVFPAAFSTYAAPLLLDSGLSELAIEGRARGNLSVHNGRLVAAKLAFREVDIEDKEQRFGLRRLDADLDWGRDEQARVSRLSWAGANLFRVDLGASSLKVRSRGMDFALAEAARIPVFDGELMIDSWDLDLTPDREARWGVDAVLTPVSLEALSAALEWPLLSGTISGVIPRVRYADGELRVGGALLVRAFDGTLTLRDLRMEEPFGLVPRLSANIGLEQLDLEALTRTFSFGRIEGRLSGRIDQLRLESWVPVAFDAAFATPKDDKSRHRISQKAVDNMSKIGGGVGGAVSRGFLGFFEDFPYDRIGISCRLENGICYMDGVAPAQNGYYIVKGRLLPPRIDVIGFAGRVDWNTLINRLKSATLESGPTIR